jgi:hypothetical protein
MFNDGAAVAQASINVVLAPGVLQVWARANDVNHMFL